MIDSRVEDWLANFRQTALAHDLQGHMALISPQVTVFGVPGFDTLGYEDWYKQCAHEFPQGLIVALDYSRIVVRTANQSQILFKALETTATADGGQISQAVEMLLQRDDGAWQLRQLRILPTDEARHDGLV
ncbi:MAG: nuclear transport factor 2 family protein [Chromatiaceae bacterium]|jgi:ketosteroid isomerase-like protein